MPRHFREISELNRTSLQANRHVRWSYLEESLRLEVIEKFQWLMQLLGLTQKELAQRSETTQPMLSRFFQGEDSRSPTLETLVKIADALNSRVEIRIIEQLPTEKFDWEERATTPPTSPTSWAGAHGVVEGQVAQVAPAMARWKYHRTVADATYDAVLTH